MESGKFELVYSAFMLLFGFSMILIFLMIVGFLLVTFTFAFLLFCWPVLVGIYLAFKSDKQGYRLELKPKDAQKLHRIIDQVAQKTGLSRPHKIILSEKSDIAVTGLMKKELILGLGTLRLLDEKDLTAIIVHEYGHFARKDTILGYFVYRIQRFIELQREINKQNIRIGYSIIFYLPTWLMFFLLSKYYALITLWYDRRIEYRADRFAADLVGEQTFANALVKYCIISNIFETVVPSHILHFLKQKKQMTNVYKYMKPIYNKKNIQKSGEQVLTAKSNWWTTHPSISERLEILNVKKVKLDINTDLPEIFNDQEKYEKDASNLLTMKMAYIAALMKAHQHEA